MRHWQQYNETEKLQLLDITSASKALPRLAVEKDWWVMAVMNALSKTEYASLMSFKGGTSLSKGWNLIFRFSEDIDIAIRREGRFAISKTTKNQLAKARRTARHYVIKELPQELTAILTETGISGFTVTPETTKERNGTIAELRADTHPSVIYVNYDSVIPETSEYVKPRVKIEISCLSMDEPVETRTLRSFISEAVSGAEDMEIKFKTVIPTRTFLEKIFLLHEEFQKKNPRSYRMSRHLYDIERIMDTSFGNEALKDLKLYDEIIAHRNIFNHIDGVDYSSHSHERINFIPPADLMDDWRNDYKSLEKHFLYNSATHLSFDQLLDRMHDLLGRIRQM